MIVEIVLGAIATWRITHMLIYENGPFVIFRRARESLGVVYDDDSDRVSSWKHEITVCPWCLSVWVGALLVLLMWAAPTLMMWMVLPFVFSAASVALGTVRVRR